MEILTASDTAAETIPRESLAQAYKVCRPSEAKVYALGGEDCQPEAPASGAVLDVVIR